MRKPRFLPVAVFAIVLSAIAGGLFGSRAFARQDEVSQQYRVFTAALAAIQREYVEDVPSDRLIYSAIDGMLHTLDPHSSFFDPRNYTQMRERQEGHYYGLGIQIQSVDGDIKVVSIFEGSPAYKKGLRRGDILSKVRDVDGTDLDMKGWTTEQAVKKLKGPKGTTVNISIKRSGYDALINMDVVRDEVNITTVRAAFMIDKETGYVKLDHSPKHQTGSRRRAAEVERERHEAARVRPARESRRRARPGDSHREPVPAPRRHDRLYARPCAQRQSELSRYGTERLPSTADRHARQSQQRERVGNRQRRAAGSRSCTHRR